MVYSTIIRFGDDVVIQIVLDPEEENFAGFLTIGENTFPIELGGGE